MRSRRSLNSPIHKQASLAGRLIIGTDPQVQLPTYIQLEGMDQVRSNRIVNLHVMDIIHSVTRLTQRKTSVPLRQRQK